MSEGENEIYPGYSEAEVETMKLFDSLRAIRSLMEKRSEGYDGMDTVMKIGGKDYDPEAIAAGIMVIHLRRFKELIDVRVPVYADFIGSIEELPYMVEAMKCFDEMEASA